MSLQETVLLQLRECILRGEFEPGQRLAEQQIAELLGSSRTPVRAALVTLEQEGLVQANESGGFVVRQFTVREVTDAIAVRGLLEGMAARLVAEHGLSRQVAMDLQSCLDEGDLALASNTLSIQDYARYVSMNDRFHALILQASGNRALQRAIAMNDKLPFAPASAMLPMQGAMVRDRDWMMYAHRQHHMLLDALRRGEGARAQALAEEHNEVAQMNMRQALERRSEAEQVMPAMRLVVGR
jgi:GntR family transcriptional regulator of vanillate catabolism